MLILISNLIFRLKRGIKRRLIGISTNSRPVSLPFISGDGFRSVCDHIFSEDFKPEKVREKDVVFVELPQLKHFFNDYHKDIKNKYILVSHNGDNAIDEEMLKFIDNKIISWYSQNVNVIHPKIIPIPIGLENLYFYNFGIPDIFNKLRKIKQEKKNKILFGFSIGTNYTERKPAYDYLCSNDNAELVKGKINAKLYLELLANYKFVASPPGNGIDCIRTWESMYLGVIPIVKRSVLTEYFQSLGLPLVIIDNWQELNLIDEQWLIKKYDNLKNNFNCQTLFMDYWINKIIDNKK